MPKSTPRILAALAIVLLVNGVQPAALAKSPATQARAHKSDSTKPRLAQNGPSLDAVVKQMEQRFNARVVRAETRQEKGRTVYVLRLLNADGKVWTVRVDADSGAVL